MPQTSVDKAREFKNIFSYPFNVAVCGSSPDRFPDCLRTVVKASLTTSQFSWRRYGFIWISWSPEKRFTRSSFARNSNEIRPNSFRRTTLARSVSKRQIAYLHTIHLIAIRSRWLSSSDISGIGLILSSWINLVDSSQRSAHCEPHNLSLFVSICLSY